MAEVLGQRMACPVHPLLDSNPCLQRLFLNVLSLLFILCVSVCMSVCARTHMFREESKKHSRLDLHVYVSFKPRRSSQDVKWCSESALKIH